MVPHRDDVVVPCHQVDHLSDEFDLPLVAAAHCRKECEIVVVVVLIVTAVEAVADDDADICCRASFTRAKCDSTAVANCAAVSVPALLLLLLLPPPLLLWLLLLLLLLLLLSVCFFYCYYS